MWQNFLQRACMEHIVDLRNYFKYLGVPVYETSYVWGDNESQIRSSTIPYARLNKRHNILSYHYVRNMISKGYIHLQHITSQWNLADTLSKNWSHQANYKKLIKPLLNFHEYENIFQFEDIQSMINHDIIELQLSEDQAIPAVG